MPVLGGCAETAVPRLVVGAFSVRRQLRAVVELPWRVGYVARIYSVRPLGLGILALAVVGRARAWSRGSASILVVLCVAEDLPVDAPAEVLVRFALSVSYALTLVRLRPANRTRARRAR